MQYFVVMQDFGRRGREAIVDPEITRREVVSRIASGEYKDVLFVHSIHDGTCEDITDDILQEAIQSVESEPLLPDLQAARFDHARDHRKHARAL